MCMPGIPIRFPHPPTAACACTRCVSIGPYVLLHCYHTAHALLEILMSVTGTRATRNGRVCPSQSGETPFTVLLLRTRTGRIADCHPMTRSNGHRDPFFSMMRVAQGADQISYNSRNAGVRHYVCGACNGCGPPCTNAN
jgi:hypothetical protein